jgi:ferredoxin-type protein NapF
MDISRRRFFAGAKSRVTTFRPPWSLLESLFVDQCTRCDDCLKICPTGLLVKGEGGFPTADFMLGYCSFCGDCAKGCTTGAIGHDLTQTPWFFGIAISENCLARQNVDCRICGEKCDVSAIRFVPRLGGAPLPEITNSSCNGCGACIAPCPVLAVQRVIPLPVMEPS